MDREDVVVYVTLALIAVGALFILGLVLSALWAGG